jgi:uncharacterized protein (TIGR03437 family)
VRQAVLRQLLLVLSSPFLFAQAPQRYAISPSAGADAIRDGGSATLGVLTYPADIAVDAAGNTYISERGGHRIRRIDPGGIITTIAGRGIGGFAGDGGPAGSALFNTPRGLAVGSNNRLYVADSLNNRIREINLATGIIRTVAGNGQYGTVIEDTAALSSPMAKPWGLKINRDGNLMVTEADSHTVRLLVFSAGILRRLAGFPQVSGGVFVGGSGGDGGPATSARLNFPVALAQEADGSILIADRGNGTLRRIKSVDQSIETVTPIKAWGLAVEADGSVLLSGDEQQSRIQRLIALNGRVTTGSAVQNLAGTGTPSRSLNFPQGIMLDGRGSLLIADVNNHVIRRLDPVSGDYRIFAGTDRSAGSGGPATQALLTFPTRAVWNSGALYIADSDAHCIRRVSGTTLTTVAGTCGLGGFGGDGGPATQALLSFPAGLAFDSSGILYISDSGNGRIRRMDLGGQLSTMAAGIGSPEGMAIYKDQKSLIIAAPGDNRIYQLSLAGGAPESVLPNNTPGFRDGPAGQAQINSPYDVAVDQVGNVLFADTGNNRVRMVGIDGQVSTLAGNGSASPGTDGNAPVASSIVRPLGLALDSAGNILVSEANARIRRVLMGPGLVDTIAGSPNAIPGPAADTSLPGTSAFLTGPVGISATAEGRIFVADTGNHRVRELSPLTTGRVDLVAGNNQTGPVLSVLPQPLSVRVVTASGIALPGVVVRFAVASGDAVLSAQSVTSVADGLASVRVTLGGIAGPIVITATVEGLPPVQFNLTATAATLPSNISAVILGGNNQQGAVLTELPVPLAIRVTGGDPSMPVPGVTVNYQVTRGTATLSASTATTDRDGVAAISVTLGGTLGPVTVSARVAGLSALVFNLTATVAGVTINYRGVVGAGSSVPAVRVLAPNSLISIYGLNFLPAGVSGRGITADDLVAGRLPTRLLGVCVTVGGIRAPLTAVYPGQVNAQVPAITGTSADVQVLARCGTAEEAVSNADTLPVAPSAPEFFYFAASADGHSAVAAVEYATGDYIGPTTVGSAFRPAKPGEILTVYFTGLGPTSPTAAPGEIPTVGAPASLPYRLQLGGQAVAAENILYVGVAPTLVIYQLNFRVPDSTPTGSQTLVLTVGDASSPPGAYVEVRR